jgi:hypothetical protein
MSPKTFDERMVNYKPLELGPFLAKLAFSRVVVDISFGLLHRA